MVFFCFRSVCGQKIINPTCLLEWESGYLPQNPCNNLPTWQRSFVTKKQVPVVNFMQLFLVISLDVFNVITDKEKF